MFGLRRDSSKRIHHGQRLVRGAGLQIFGIERVNARFDRRGSQQAVPMRKAVCRLYAIVSRLETSKTRAVGRTSGNIANTS